MPPTNGYPAGAGSPNATAGKGSTRATVPSGTAPGGMSANVPPAPSTRPPVAPTTTLPSAPWKGGTRIVVALPTASRMVISSRSLRSAATTPLKLPSAFGVRVVSALFRRLRTITTPPGSAVPGAPTIVEFPDASGIEATTVPAAGADGGVCQLS